MKLKKIILTVSNLSMAKILHRRIPLAVSWALTYRCNTKCLYCRIGDVESKELDTREILSILDELVARGMVRVSFTGGEPLLRDDIGKIIDYASKKGTYVSISSNGILVKEKISQIRNVGSINLSLDGPEKIHDLLRRGGSHYKAMEAIKAFRSNGIKVVLTTVLSKHNLDYIDYVLNIAQQFGIRVLFQPATCHILGGSDINPVVSPEEKYKEVIAKLIIKRRERNSNILNSIAGLKHLYHWPMPKDIPCSAGKFFFRIKPNGWIGTCDRASPNNYSDTQDTLKLGVREAIRRLPPFSCNFCWCASLVEFNLGTSFNLSAIINILNQI